jgi:phosphoribosylformylglycinamidine synthase
MGQLVGCIEGMAEACRALDFPIVSGNVSLYNETKAEDGTGSAILPTPAIGGVGLLQDWRKSATIGFKRENDAIWLIGGEGTHLGQSLWLREVLGREEGPPPPVDLDKERANGELVRSLIEAGSVNAVHDVSDGGLLVAIAEMSLAGGIGAILDRIDDPAVAFGEDQGRFVVTSAPGVVIPGARRIGTVGGRRLEMSGADAPTIDYDAMLEAHERFFPALMGGELTVA